MSSAKPLSIVVATQRLSQAKMVQVGEACSRLNAHVSLCGEQQLKRAQGDVLIAGISAGSYRIPEEYLDFLEQQDRDSPLVLLSQQGLRRPRIELCDGIVTLLAPELGSDAIYSRLRVLQAERRIPEKAGDELATPRFWTADFRCRDTMRSFRTHTQETLSVEFELSTPDGRGAAADSGTQSLTVQRGALRLQATPSQWRVSWPRRAGTLWLLSPSRLPRMLDVAHTHGGGEATLSAESADIMLAFSSSVGPQRSSEIVGSLLPHLASGAPAVFDLVQTALTSLSNSWCSIVELR